MWYLLNRKEQGTPNILARYKTLGAARVGMRASNKNAGWARITRAQSGQTDMEWCAKSNGLPVYDYGPYVLMHQYYYDQKYGMDELVEVKNLMSGLPVMIPRRDRGGPCDPSMERYWSM